MDDGVRIKQDRFTIPSSLREKLLRKLHAANRRSELTLRHACNCVFWPGLSSQITDECQSRTTCAQHAHQHPLEPLQLSQDLFELKGVAYLVTVDHYSDFYEINRLPTIQSSRPPGSTSAGMAFHTRTCTLITDNGAQFTSDLFQTFAKRYQFNHITSSPYWLQLNGRADAAVKSAKHILITADSVDLALLSVSNTVPPLLDTPFLSLPRDTVVTDHIQGKLKQKNTYD